jgi:hypothetical protein
VKYLRTSFRLGEGLKPHNFHVADSLSIFHKFEDGLILDTIVGCY